MAIRRRRAVERREGSADLYFAQAYAPHGFTHPALSHFDGDAEPVVRELLQNSVDAADKADRPCVVSFEIRNIEKDKLPGFKTSVTRSNRLSPSGSRTEGERQRLTTNRALWTAYDAIWTPRAFQC